MKHRYLTPLVFLVGSGAFSALAVHLLRIRPVLSTENYTADNPAPPSPVLKPASKVDWLRSLLKALTPADRDKWTALIEELTALAAKQPHALLALISDASLELSIKSTIARILTAHISDQDLRLLAEILTPTTAPELLTSVLQTLLVSKRTARGLENHIIAVINSLRDQAESMSIVSAGL